VNQPTAQPAITDTVNRWFPLVPRPRPPARPLPQRVREIGQLAAAAAEADGSDGLLRAAEALNKAALLASDCAAEQLARQWCWAQFNLFHAAAPLDAATAELAAQPIVNLGRLLIRAHQPDRAHALFRTAFTAADTRTPATIDDTPIDLAGLTDGQDSHRHLRQFLWTVLLADGTRALTSAGRWREALDCLRAHKGVGTRMLDGRQTAIIERCLAADPDTATTLLDTSTTTDRWESAVADTLRALSAHLAGQPSPRLCDQAARRYLELGNATDTVIFRTRLGLTLLELTEATGQNHADVHTRILQEASKSGDAHTARTVLEHPASRTPPSHNQAQRLTAIVAASGLGRGRIPHHLKTELADHIHTAQTALRRGLASRRHTNGPR
jgi:hypothetical protein